MAERGGPRGPRSGGAGKSGGAGDRGRGGAPSGRGGAPSGRGGPRREGSGDSRGARGDRGGEWTGDRSGSQGRRDTRGAGGRPTGGQRGGRPDSGGRDEDRPRRTPEEQAKYDGPPLSDEITGNELDRNVAAQLRGLPERLAARVARHLVAAGQLIDEDPETAYQHTVAARARASRIAVVREAAGEAAYAAGHFSEALAELRAAKRMNGAPDYLHVMADCERALGRPERALELAKSPSVGKLPRSLQVEMLIVEAGARFDLGEVDGALRTLENGPLRTDSREEWAVRLRYAYADLLLQAGRREAAVEWFHRTAGIDGAGLTDAAERIMQLEGVTVEQSDDDDE